MGILVPTSNFQNSLKNTNKIPDYAREYRNEYLFIRGINKSCEKFVEILGREEIFKSHQACSLISMFVIRLNSQVNYNFKKKKLI